MEKTTARQAQRDTQPEARPTRIPSAADTYPVLIVGFGYAGRRFARVIQYLADGGGGGTLVLGGICDIAHRARTGAAEIAPVFDDLDEAMAAIRPFCVVVAVNEEWHARVLTRLALHRPPMIICEKPLTATLGEAEALPKEIIDTALTLNFIERQSTVLASYFDWAEQQRGLRAVRVEFWWGKHRLRDGRPTMGVLSEMTHPIDLAHYLFGFERFELVHAHGIVSDFSPHRDESLDTVSVVARADECVVLGSASFAWPRRVRVLTALLADAAECVFRLTIEFDTPHWDCDRLRLERIDWEVGRSELLFEVATDNAHFPPELFGVAKVATFVRDSFERARLGARCDHLVGYAHAIRVQRILADLDDRLSSGSITASPILRGTQDPSHVPHEGHATTPAEEAV